MAGVVGRDVEVPVDRVAADEVAGVDHPVRVRARVLPVDVELAEHRRRRRLARGGVVDPPHLAAVDQREHLLGEIGLDVVAVLGVAHLEAPAAREHAAEHARRRDEVARVARHLAPGHHRALGRRRRRCPTRDGVVQLAEPVLEQAHHRRRAARRRLAATRAGARHGCAGARAAASARGSASRAITAGLRRSSATWKMPVPFGPGRSLDRARLDLLAVAGRRAP